MTIVVAPDKFKGSLTAEQACSAIEKGIRKISADIKIVSIPLADGGEGTAQLLTRFAGGKMITIEVKGPDFNPVQAAFGISRDGKTAFMEMAKASGLLLLPASLRNPMNTTTYGTGQMIRHALDLGVDNIVMGIGGSATNDGGIGMAAALGYEFTTDAHKEILPVGKNLSSLSSIRKGKTHPRLFKTKITVLCDVDNPLYGEGGAAHVFGPQKGASPDEVITLDNGLRKFEEIVQKELQLEANFPGAGAAGGFGAGARVFLNATIVRGFDFIADFTSLTEKIKSADLVITGEGKVDAQTLSGKLVVGVASLAKNLGKPCVAFTGKCEITDEEAKQAGIEHVITLSDTSTTETAAMKDASALLEKRAFDFVSYWRTDR